MTTPKGTLSGEQGVAEREVHTPGPWVVGATLGMHLRHGSDRCDFCDRYPLVATTKAKPGNPKEFSDTIHEHLLVSDDSSFHEIVSATSGVLVVGQYDYDSGGVCTSMADACLIAAAPDLLEACRAALNTMVERCSHNGSESDARIISSTLTSLRAAIAKATVA